MVYFVSPGVLPFLTSNDTIVQSLFFAANASNMLGRLLTAFVQFWHLWLLNVICVLAFAYEFMVASWPTWSDSAASVFPLPSWILVPVTVVFAFSNGYLSTAVYMAGSRTRALHTMGALTTRCTRSRARHALRCTLAAFSAARSSRAPPRTGDRAVLKEFGDARHAKKVRRYVSLMNQVGSLLGTYLCVLVIHVGLMGAFRQ